MKRLSAIIGHPLFIYTILVGVGVWLLVVPAFTGQLGANPIEKLLHQTGAIAIWLLAAVLSLTPLRVLWPKFPIVQALNRHRRPIGVSVWIYGLLHFSLHLLYEGSVPSILRSFSNLFIWLGAFGLFLLTIIALTSNNFSLRKLGGKTWKRIHRLSYLAAVLVLVHQAIAGKGHWQDTRWIVFGLGALQIARISKQFLNKRKAPVRQNVVAAG